MDRHGGPVYSAAEVQVERPSPKSRTVSVDQLILEVCGAMGVPLHEFYGVIKHPRVVAVRRLCSFLIRENTYLSFPEIARLMRRPNHSTIITQYKEYLRTVDVSGMMKVGQSNNVHHINIRPGYEAAMRVIQKEV